MPLSIEVEQEEDGRWLADAPDLPGVSAYGPTSAEAVAKVQSLGLRLLADRLDRGDRLPDRFADVFAVRS